MIQPLLAAWLFQTAYTLPEIAKAPPPVPPVQTVDGGAVAFQAQVDRQGNIKQLRLLAGRSPFVQSATQAVSQWKFVATRNEAPTEARVGIFVLFRQRALFTAEPAKQEYDWSSPETERAALPISISHPRYPINTVAEGVVILRLHINPSGDIEDMRVIRDVPPLTAAAQTAVRGWEFSPARSQGHSVPGTVIVAISFVRPFVQSPRQGDENPPAESQGAPAPK